MKHGLVYLIFDKTNGKVYVGQTVQGLEQRKIDEIKYGECGPKLRLAIKQRAWALTWFPLTFVDSKEELDIVVYLHYKRIIEMGDTAIMYLIQRKSDGLFYRNPDYHGRLHSVYGPSKGKDLWTARKANCKPFKTIQGAKSSREWSRLKEVPSETVSDGCWKWAQHGKRITCPKGAFHNEDCYYYNKWVPQTDEENPNRVIEVKVKLTVS